MFIYLNSLIVGSALQYSSTQHLINCLTAIVSFYLAQWEEYRTGSMYLGYVNVTEALVASELLLLATAYFGPTFWLVSGWRDYVFGFVFISAIVGDCVYVYNTVKATRVKPNCV